MKISLILHILRNPYNWSEEKRREAAIKAADLIEQKVTRPKTTKTTEETLSRSS